MEQPPRDTHAAPVVVVPADEWSRLALRWPDDWVIRPARWILHLVLGWYLLTALISAWGASAPDVLRAVPGPSALFEPVVDPAYRLAGAALVAALLVLVVAQWALGRLLAWVLWLELGAMAWVSLRSGEATAVVWIVAWVAASVVCLMIAVPLMRRAVTLRRWAERATELTFLDSAAVAAAPDDRPRRLLGVGLALVGICVLWNGLARLIFDTASGWPPHPVGDLAPWGLGLLGLCLVLVDVVRALVGTLLRHSVPPMVIEFATTELGPLQPRTEAGESGSDGAGADESGSGPRRRLNDLTPTEFVAVVEQEWVWHPDAPVLPEDLVDFTDHPARVLGFGYEGLGGPSEYRSLTAPHRRHGISFVERMRYSPLRRHPAPRRRITLAEARRGEVIDSVDLAPIGIAGLAVRCAGERPRFVPRDRAGEPSRH